MKGNGFRKTWVLVLILALLFWSGRGYGEESQSPQKIVANFILKRAEYDFFGKNPKYCKEITAFIVNGEQYLNEYCGGGIPIIAKFSILSVVFNKNYTEAQVKVKHDFCGSCANDGSCTIEKTSEIGIYKLIKINDVWKIKEWYGPTCSFPCDGWMSVKKAIEMQKHILKNYTEFKYLGPKKKIEDNIIKLKRCSRGVN